MPDIISPWCNAAQSRPKTVADAYAYVVAHGTVRLPKSWKKYPNTTRFFAHRERDAIARKIIDVAAREPA